MSRHWTLVGLKHFVPGPAARVSLGLSSLVLSLVLMADLMFGMLPEQGAQQRDLRTRVAENLAVQTAVLLEGANPRAIDHLLRDVMLHDKGVKSMAVRRSDGSIFAQSGDHATAWEKAAKEGSGVDNVQIPLTMAGQHWGGVEISFAQAMPQTFWQWLSQPSVLVYLVLGPGSFLGFSLYLRRVLSLLDPSTVIPERVRSAFDVFSGGVMIVDPASHVMLANAALRSWMGGPADEALTGRAVETLAWFKNALPGDRKAHPWVRAMSSGTSVEGEQMEFRLANGEPLMTVVKTSPIMDESQSVRGCLVTFDNVTNLHNLNVQLVKSMAELNESKREVESKNLELQQLATRDPLTGCLNRRALFGRIDGLFADARARDASLCCIMSDIDHFKLFNDKHGHAVGDQVLQAVTRSLGSALREVDLLCRYGGEEFCIFLPDISQEQAVAVAERLRQDVQLRAGASIRSIAGLEVTSSFGVSTIGPEVHDAAQMIDMADQALYDAKESGRNRVLTFHAKLPKP